MGEWIEHNDVCPLAGEEWVEVEIKGVGVKEGRVSSFDWVKDGGFGDIIRFRRCPSRLFVPENAED